jgi:hypothetical protein
VVLMATAILPLARKLGRATLGCFRRQLILRP